MSASGRERVSSYLQYLPAVLREGPFLGRFLLGFEAVLTGGGVPAPEGPVPLPVGLEALIESIPTFLDPWTAPSDFLPWLAQWVALGLRDDWPDAMRRRLIASVVPLYALRGTRQGIELALQLALSKGAGDVTVSEPDSPPHYFEVSLTIGIGSDPEETQRTIRMVEGIIDQQKPAHTFYSLYVSCPAMQIVDRPTSNAPGIRVGQNTIVGSVAVTLST